MMGLKVSIWEGSFFMPYIVFGEDFWQRIFFFSLRVAMAILILQSFGDLCNYQIKLGMMKEAMCVLNTNI